MATQVPIRCTVTIILQCDIDITQKNALKNKMTQVVQNIKTEFPDKISDNKILIDTDFAKDEWKV